MEDTIKVQSNDYRLNLLSEELDEYKAAVLKLTENNERLNSTCLQLQSSELKQYLEKVNYERENLRLRKTLEEIREMCNNTCEYNKDCIHSCYECKSIDESVAINRILNKINEVLK